MTVASRIAVLASALSDDPRDAARRARDAGFAGLLFDAQARALDLTELSDTGRREFRHMLASQQQALVGLRYDLDPKGLSAGADVDRILSRLDEILRAARDVTAGVVCVDLGPLPEPLETARPKAPIAPGQLGAIILPDSATVQTASARRETIAPAPPDPAFVSQVDATLDALGEIADRYRVNVAFSSSLASFAAVERSLTAVRCPWFGIDLDPVAILRDRWACDETFSRIGRLIRHVTARDAAVGSDRRTRPVELGKGGAGWSELLASLDAAGFAGWITVDPTDLPDRAGAAIRGAEFLRSILSGR
jgi:sugar phosphate isomerase/epimerase